MTVAIVNFLRFKTRGGSFLGGYSFQNFFVGESRDGHLFAPFAVKTGAGAKGGDRVDAAIVAPNVPLAVNLFVEAAAARWLVEVRTVLLDPMTYATVQQVSVETWLCGKPELRVQQAVLRLMSPLDAVDGQVPRRTLSTRLVGSLPSTGSISVS